MWLYDKYRVGMFEYISDIWNYSCLCWSLHNRDIFIYFKSG